MPTRAVVELRRPLTPAQTRVLELLVEAPGYKIIADTLGCSKRTVREHIAAIAATLPEDFAPSGQPKERATLYAMRVWALEQIARARSSSRAPTATREEISGRIVESL